MEDRPTYRLADMETGIPAWKERRMVEGITLRAIVLHDPQDEKPMERWPAAYLTDDWDIEARALPNE